MRCTAPEIDVSAAEWRSEARRNFSRNLTVFLKASANAQKSLLHKAAFADFGSKKAPLPLRASANRNDGTQPPFLLAGMRGQRGYPSAPANMDPVRKTYPALKRRICPTANITFRGSTRRLFVAASTRRLSTPPGGTARVERRTYTSTCSGSRGASPCRFFPPFLFEKRKAGAGRGLSGKVKN